MKGDFDGAIQNYLLGKTDIIPVFMLFPEIVPALLLQQYLTNCSQSYNSLLTNSTTQTKLSGIILHRAASALVHYCESWRSKVVIFLYSNIIE
jgi:hypothetical protein